MRKTLMLGAAALAAASYAAAVAAPANAGPGDIILAQDRTSPGTPGTAPPKGANSADQAARERTQRLQAAQPITQANVSADAIIGTEVRNTQDQKIGSVKDLVMQDGKIVGMILARGGVLGMGTDYHQIDLQQAKITSDAKTVVLDLGEDQAKALPKVAYKDGKWSQVVADDRGTTPPKTAPGAPPSGTTTPPSTEKKIEPAPKTPPADKPKSE